MKPHSPIHDRAQNRIGLLVKGAALQSSATECVTFFRLDILIFSKLYINVRGFLSVTVNGTLGSFPCLAVRSSSAHKGKIIIFERFL